MICDTRPLLIGYLFAQSFKRSTLLPVCSQWGQPWKSNPLGHARPCAAPAAGAQSQCLRLTSATTLPIPLPQVPPGYQWAASSTAETMGRPSSHEQGCRGLWNRCANKMYKPTLRASVAAAAASEPPSPEFRITSLVPKQAETIRAPDAVAAAAGGHHDTQCTGAPISQVRTHRPERTSHRRMVLSSEPDRSHCPLASGAMLRTWGE